MRVLFFPVWFLGLLSRFFLTLVEMVFGLIIPAIPLVAISAMFFVVIISRLNLQPSGQAWKLTTLPSPSLETQLTQVASGYQKYLPKFVASTLIRLSDTERAALLTKLGKKPSWAKQQQYWQKVLSQQPTDRDVLLNLAKLAEAEGNRQKAQEYTEKARKTDPNNPVFSQ